jgi:hypothetical protein
MSAVEKESLAIRKALLALNRTASAVEIAAKCGLPAAVVSRRLLSCSSRNAKSEFGWFTKNDDGWKLTPLGREPKST